MKTILVFILFLTACGCPHKPQVNIDPILQPYFDSFFQAGMSQQVTVDISDIIIQFKVLSASGVNSIVYGSCTSNINETPVVSINPNYWYSMTHDLQESLVYHELGHCLLGRGHTTAMFKAPDGTEQPVSIMYPNSTVVVEYGILKSYYIQELFQGAKQ